MDSFIAHYGIEGMKWGIRRFQYENGSYTEEGKARYSKSKEIIRAKALKEADKDLKYWKASNQISKELISDLERKKRNSEDVDEGELFTEKYVYDRSKKYQKAWEKKIEEIKNMPIDSVDENKLEKMMSRDAIVDQLISENKDIHENYWNWPKESAVIEVDNKPRIATINNASKIVTDLASIHDDRDWNTEKEKSAFEKSLKDPEYKKQVEEFDKAYVRKLKKYEKELNELQNKYDETDRIYNQENKKQTLRDIFYPKERMNRLGKLLNEKLKFSSEINSMKDFIALQLIQDFPKEFQDRLIYDYNWKRMFY